jgi:hypothetical protein
MTRLEPGDTFPAITVTLVDGESLHLPDDLAGPVAFPWRVVSVLQCAAARLPADAREAA